jgi:hypothetical protein
VKVVGIFSVFNLNVSDSSFWLKFIKEELLR